MPLRPRFLATLFPALLASLLLPGPPSHAQEPAAAPPPPSQRAAQPPPSAPAPYTLHTQSRIVLLDVAVSDRHGNPVHNLPESAFHVLDNKQPQTVSHFEEHVLTSTPVSVSGTLPRGTFSNDFFLHAPPVLNILMLDISNLGIEDQMFLHQQLLHLVDALPLTGPEAQPLAIYTRSSGACILVQDFTTDRARLRSAIDRTLPRLFQPNPYLDDVTTLAQISMTIADLPGRKNLLWFTGGAPLQYVNPVLLDSDPSVFRDDARVRAVYDEHEADRIAVDTIDARGLTVTGGLGQMTQHALMDDVAEATGGHALYNNIGVAAGAARILDTDRSFYTLTYAPANFRPDHKWHRVRLRVDDPDLRLSYRAGYFSDATRSNAVTVSPATSAPEQRPRLLADGSTRKDAEPPRTVPIIFQARILPASDPAVLGDTRPAALLHPVTTAHRGSVTYSIRYTVPAGSFSLQTVGGKPSIVLDVAAIAFNKDGTAIAHTAQKVTLAINPGELPLRPGITFPLLQQLALGKGDLSLYLAVWDTVSGRMGTLQVPLSVTPPARH